MPASRSRFPKRRRLRPRRDPAKVVVADDRLHLAAHRGGPRFRRLRGGELPARERVRHRLRECDRGGGAPHGRTRRTNAEFSPRLHLLLFHRLYHLSSIFERQSLSGKSDSFSQFAPAYTCSLLRVKRRSSNPLSDQYFGDALRRKKWRFSASLARRALFLGHRRVHASLQKSRRRRPLWPFYFSETASMHSRCYLLLVFFRYLTVSTRLYL